MTEAPLLKGELREPGWAVNSRGAAWEGKRAGQRKGDQGTTGLVAWGFGTGVAAHVET